MASAISVTVTSRPGSEMSSLSFEISQGESSNALWSGEIRRLVLRSSIHPIVRPSFLDRSESLSVDLPWRDGALLLALGLWVMAVLGELIVNWINRFE